jgi:tetratricopeptide (TPR) repeat protein
VIVGDLGSTDDTVAQCQSRGATVLPVIGMDRSEARNHLLNKSPKGTHFYIEPWERLVQGHDSIVGEGGFVRVMQGTSISHEVRVWDGSSRFVNPVFERLDAEGGKLLPVIVSSSGGIDADQAIQAIDGWKRNKPLLASPYYYQACLLFAQAKYDDYLKVADHYLFMEKKEIMPITMTRYYYAMAHLIHKRLHRPALQNINLCLCVKPLMAEFWCLMADVYYHLLNRFDVAKSFYENAITLGSRRLQTDLWPMDFSKYGKYPKKMIESCDKIIGGSAVYSQANRR